MAASDLSWTADDPKLTEIIQLFLDYEPEVKYQPPQSGMPLMAVICQLLKISTIFKVHRVFFFDSVFHKSLDTTPFLFLYIHKTKSYTNASFLLSKKYLLKIYGKIELSKTINHLPERRYNLMITDKQLTLASSSFRRVPYSTIKCTDLYQIFT